MLLLGLNMNLGFGGSPADAPEPEPAATYTENYPLELIRDPIEPILGEILIDRPYHVIREIHFVPKKKR